MNLTCTQIESAIAEVLAELGDKDQASSFGRLLAEHQGAIAKAALGALFDPTREMLSAGAFYHIQGAGGATNVETTLARDSFRAMIKVAMST